MTARMDGKRGYWSKEPDEEPDYSDWRVTFAKKSDPSIVSTNDSEEKEVSFLLHRFVLGPVSEYFSRLFKSPSSDYGPSFLESNNQHSRINLPPTLSGKSFDLIIEGFESLLDFYYYDKVDFKGVSPLSLLFLCDYFQMEAVFKSRVEDYSEKEIKRIASENNLHLLYENIIDFRTAGLNIETIQKVLSIRCYLEEDLLSDTKSLAETADLPLWLDVVSITETNGIYLQPRPQPNDTVRKSIIWSKNIAHFLHDNVNASNVDVDAFQKLTSEKVIPYVDINAALVLLKVEQKLASVKINNNHCNDGNDNGESNDFSKSTFLQVSNLQKRCVESLVKAKLELKSNTECRNQSINVMLTLPNVMAFYLHKTLNVFGNEKGIFEENTIELGEEILELEEKLRIAKQRQKKSILIE